MKYLLALTILFFCCAQAAANGCFPTAKAVFAAHPTARQAVYTDRQGPTRCWYAAARPLHKTAAAPKKVHEARQISASLVFAIAHTPTVAPVGHDDPWSIAMRMDAPIGASAFDCRLTVNHCRR